MHMHTKMQVLKVEHLNIEVSTSHPDPHLPTKPTIIEKEEMEMPQVYSAAVAFSAQDDGSKSHILRLGSLLE